MKRLMGFLFLVSFFLPFTAEGAMLAIHNYSCVGAGKTATFGVAIEGYSGEIGIFSFDVKYDPDILEYKGKTGSVEVDVDYLHVKDHGSYLEVKGTGNVEVLHGGRIAYLKFKVKKCEETTLELTDLHGDFWQWRTSNGSLIPREEGGVVYNTFFPYGFHPSNFGALASYGFGYPFSNYGTYNSYNYWNPFSSFGAPGSYGFGYPFSNYGTLWWI